MRGDDTSAVSASPSRKAWNRGVWVAYGLDHSEHWSTTVFADELAARRYAMPKYLSVGFLRYGDPLGTVQDSEGRA